MQLFLLLLRCLTALSLLGPVVARTIIPVVSRNTHPGSAFRLSLSARALPEVEPRPHEDPVPDPVPKPVEPQPPSGDIVRIGPSGEQIATDIQNLPKPKWYQSWKSKVPDIFRSNLGSGKTLFRTDARGEIASLYTYDLSNMVTDLKKLPGTEVWKLSGDENSKLLDTKTGTVYEEMHFSTAAAIGRYFNFAGGRGGPTYVMFFDHSNEKRSANPGVLQTLNDPSGESTDSTQAAATLFEQYLEMLYAIQASVGALIAPVLTNITSQTNNTLIHQMAQSIFLDLTGSTVALVGPFNYGVSYLSNASESSNGQKANNTAAESADITLLENIYAAMWVQAMVAANSTGLLADQIYLTGCLYTNDTSIYPQGFTTVSKSNNGTNVAKV